MRRMVAGRRRFLEGVEYDVIFTNSLSDRRLRSSMVPISVQYAVPSPQ